MLVAKRRLGFLHKEGFDRFGKNKLFAPLITWESLKERLQNIRENAQWYEEAYNDVQKTIQQQEDLQKVLEALPEATSAQLRAQIERLEESRRGAISEKGAYTAVSFVFSFLERCRFRGVARNFQRVGGHTVSNR